MCCTCTSAFHGGKCFNLRKFNDKRTHYIASPRKLCLHLFFNKVLRLTVVPRGKA